MSSGCDGPSLAGPRTPGDVGEADPALEAALTAWADAGTAPAQARVYAAMPAARLFVPVVATLVEAETSEATGLRGEKSSEMSVVTLVAPSGATALPAFTSTASMRRWRLDARPVPVSGREACLAALDGGHAAVVVEPGAARFPVEGPALTALAEGWVPAAGQGAAGRLASRRVGEGLRLVAAAEPLPREVEEALAAALRGEREVGEAYLLDAAVGDEPPVRTVGVVLRHDVTPDALAALAARLQCALGPGPAAALDLAVLSAAQREGLAGQVAPLLQAPALRPPPPVPPAGRRRWWRRGR